DGGGTSGGGGGRDSGRDAPTDGTSAKACDPDAPFGAPVALDAPINSSASEFSPSFTTDENTIVFERTVDLTNRSILIATRANRTEPFSTPAAIPTLTQGITVGAIGTPTITGDGLAIFYHGEVNGDDADIFTASRTVTTGTFGDARKLGRVNATQVDVFPSVMQNGAELWFTSERLGGITRHLFRSVRDNIGAYQEATVVSELRSSNNEAGVAFSADGLTVYFGSERPGGLGDSDIWVARRQTLQGAFGAATPVTALNSAATELPAWASADGCRIYFTSDRAGSMDVFVASRP
ncbi:MAG: OmpA family protein, partial [Labilithrix sp.]|nr:OmpA family protein [Labilithrix sp.]